MFALKGLTTFLEGSKENYQPNICLVCKKNIIQAYFAETSCVQTLKN